MDKRDSPRAETEALIEAIWGAPTPVPARPPDPALRARQNADLAAAMRAYLQQYLADAGDETPRG